MPNRHGSHSYGSFPNLSTRQDLVVKDHIRTSAPSKRIPVVRHGNGANSALSPTSCKERTENILRERSFTR